MANRLYALGRLKAGVRNKTEAAYEELLKAQVQCGEIVWFKFASVTLKLAKDTRYTPDFVVLLPDGTLEMHEVKSIWLGDAKAKIKIASELYPFVFKAIYAVTKKCGGGWKVESF